MSDLSVVVYGYSTPPKASQSFIFSISLIILYYSFLFACALFRG